jgi:fatty-acyl-CoA synthase
MLREAVLWPRGGSQGWGDVGRARNDRARVIHMNLAHWVERHAAFAPGKAAIRFAGQELSYGALAERVRQAAGRLAALGVGQGDVVGFLGFNDPEMLVLLFACARAGAILLPLNWRLAPPEHARVLGDARPRVVVVGPGCLAQAAVLRETMQGMVWLSLDTAAPGWPAWSGLAPACAAPRPTEEASFDAPVLLCYTSGSTGAPKGVVLTQEALFWNAVNSAHMHDLTSADRVLTTLPMFHVGGLNIQTMPALHAGATVELQAKFDPSAALEAIERGRITLAVFVPAQLTALMEHPRWQAADLSSLRMLTTGSTIVPETFVRRVHERGVPLVQVYGSTETCPIAAYLRVEEADRKAGSAGLPALYGALRIVDDAGNDRAAGEVGEILVRGPSLMRQYWNAPEATALAMREGWYRSGDIGRLDRDGYLYVVARKHDMIISGGENIYPAELETILLECPAILEACVVGRPDARWGEAVVAAVALKPDARMSEADVLALFDGRLARYKRPREVRFVEALPRSALGKVKRDDLRAAVASAVAA